MPTSTVALVACMSPWLPGVFGVHADFSHDSLACSRSGSQDPTCTLAALSETSLLQRTTGRASASPRMLTNSRSNNSNSTGNPVPTRFLLHHMWKCGGTHICDVAKKAGFAVPENPGCHRLREDNTSAGFPSVGLAWQACAVGRPGLAKVPFDVIGHECGVNADIIDAGEAEGFAWIGIVRDPVEQALSWLAHARHGNKTLSNISFEQWIQNCTEAHPCGFFTLVPNLQTRWLAGGRCLNDPSEAGCVSLAVRNLGRMVAVLEQSGGSLLGREKLQKLGWAIQPEPQHESGAGREVDKLSIKAREYIEKLQHIDIDMIRAARAAGII